MMRRTILRDKIIQVVLDGEDSLTIEKCDGYDNFDDHGSDWAIPLDDLDEAKALIALLAEAVRLAELDSDEEESEEDEE